MGRIEKCTIKKASDGKRQEVGQLNLEPGKGILGSAYEGEEETLQVALMDKEAQDRGRELQPDGFCITRFKENLLLSGVDLPAIAPGDRIQAGESLLEITIAGKKCYPNCPVYQREGNCGLDRYAAFAKVTKKGNAKTGDEAKILDGDV